VARFGRMTALRRAGVAAALTAVLAGISTTGYVVVSALAAPVTPAPVILTHPVNPDLGSR